MESGYRRDVVVLVGARSLADEQAAIKTGHSHLKYPQDSKHVIVPGTREFSEAVDLALYPVRWDVHQDWLDLGALVKSCAADLGVTISWGGDWPHPFDWEHFELA